MSVANTKSPAEFVETSLRLNAIFYIPLSPWLGMLSQTGQVIGERALGVQER